MTDQWKETPEKGVKWAIQYEETGMGDPCEYFNTKKGAMDRLQELFDADEIDTDVTVYIYEVQNIKEVTTKTSLIVG